MDKQSNARYFQSNGRCFVRCFGGCLGAVLLADAETWDAKLLGCLIYRALKDAAFDVYGKPVGLRNLGG